MEENKNTNVLNENEFEDTIDLDLEEFDEDETSEQQTENTDKKSKKVKKAKKNKKSDKNGGFKAFMKSRKARFGFVASAIVAIVVVITVVLNIIVGILVDKFPNIVLDLTENASFELEKDTVDYVSHISKDVKITVLSTEKSFKSAGEYYDQANTLLKKIEQESNDKIKLSYIDLTANPSLTQKYEDADWTGNNNLFIVECGDSYKVVPFADCFEYDQQSYYYYGTYDVTNSKVEQAVVTAILNVTTEDKILVNIATGNGENEEYYSGLKTLLSNNAYETKEISLLTEEIDKDADFLLIDAPTVDFDVEQIDKISNWLDNNGNYGKSLIFIPSENEVDTPNIDDLLEEWGMKVNKGYVFESSPNRLISSQSLFTFTVDYTDTFKDGLKNSNIPVATLYSRSIEIIDGTSVTTYPLFKTSTQAGIVTSDDLQDENWDYKEHISAEELNIGVEAVQTNADNISSRVIVFGSNAMFTGSVMSYNSYNNSAYFMNMMNTIANRDDAGITIESKSLDNKELSITNVATKNVLFIIFVLILPLGTLITGIVIWTRRRNK